VRKDQHRLRVSHCQRNQAVGQRWQATTCVDQDRHVRAFGEPEHVIHLAPVKDEVLRSRMQLYPAGTRLQAALALG